MVDLDMPPDVEKTRGVNESSSTSRILCSYLHFPVCGIQRPTVASGRLGHLG